jgi:plasmid maintenance system antidote protein VapI
MIPKKGKVFPGGAKTSEAVEAYAVYIGTALREELGDTHQAIKKLVRWTGANERTVKNWLSGRVGPNGSHLVRLVRHSDATLQAFLGLAQRPSLISAVKVVEIHGYLAKSVAELGSMVNSAADAEADAEKPERSVRHVRTG